MNDLAWCAAVEQDRLFVRPSRERERADSSSGLIFVDGKEVVQACVAESVEEPLAIESEDQWDFTLQRRHRR